MTLLPTVVDAPDLSGLIELSRDPHLDLKPIILRVQVDLFLTAPVRDRATRDAFAALVTGLLPTVDDETALTVAQKLASFPETPEIVLARLAERGEGIRAVIEAGRAAAPIPPFMPPWAADDLSETERAGLADTAARLPRNLLDRALARARRDRDVAVLLLERGDVPPAELAPLWLHADAEGRGAIRDAVAATAALRPCPPAPRELSETLVRAAGAADVAGFVAALSESLGIPKTFLSAAPDPSTRYDLLTLALRTAGVREEEAIYVFLTLNESVARSVARVFGLTALFRGLDRGTARDLLGAILGADLAGRTGVEEAHRPYLAPDAARPRHAAGGLERAPLRAGLQTTLQATRTVRSAS